MNEPRLLSRIAGFASSQAPAHSPLPQIEPRFPEEPTFQPPAPLSTIEISNHHASGGCVAVFAGDRGIGQTPLEALGALVQSGAFGRFHVIDRT